MTKPFCRVLYGDPSVHGALFSNRKSYGQVRCGWNKSEVLRCCSQWFSGTVNPTVRFGFEIYISYGAVRWGFKKSEILRCG